MNQAKATQFFVVRAVGRIILGQPVSKILIILSFSISTSKNKNTNHRVKEFCAIMSIQVTYETNHISLICDSAISNALYICSFMYFIAILKKKIKLEEL